jgi:hypothetical protein
MMASVRIRVLVAALLIWVAVVGSTGSRASARVQGPTTPASADAAQVTAVSLKPVIDRYCVTCHNGRLKTGGLALDGVDLSKVAEHADVLEKVVRKVRGGMMPPQGALQPDAATRASIVSTLVTGLDRVAALQPNPGRPGLHRLNRVEYANAIHDLLSLDVDVASLLPPDDSSYGFDNIADALGVSPVLLERYVNAAERISALAVGDTSVSPIDEVYKARMDQTQTEHIEGLPLGTRGGILANHYFPVDGEYIIRTKLYLSSVGWIRGMQTEHQVEVAVDGERQRLARVGGTTDYQVSVVNPTELAKEIEDRLVVRVPVKAGEHEVYATFLYRSGGRNLGPESWQQPLSTLNPVSMEGVPAIGSVTISGPFKVTGPGATASRKAIFSCRPSAVAEEATCARSILTRLSRRAYRRPVGELDLAPLMRLYDAGRKGASFDRGIQMAIAGILSSPDFTFRVEREPATLRAATNFRLSDLDLASRLSFFLWSSIPDDTLTSLAVQGQLHTPAVLEQQVRRMLADPKAGALVSNFAGQWLYLRNLRNFVPDVQVFPDFDDPLRKAMQRETELLFESVMRDDRDVTELLTADYTFVNERLARHYGMKGVLGSNFRRVPVTDDARRGLLGQASILTVTSDTTRTSPVKRGKWILENILGTPPPPPPPAVPALPDKGEGGTVLPLRERLAAHRANPACASCHRIMDPLGFALENFDATGAWRLRDANVPVDPSDTLADGTKVNGPVALRQALLRNPDVFVQTMTEKMLTYALGRGLEYYDMPTVRAIVRDASRDHYRFSSLVLGIVKSTPFQMSRRAAAADTE